MFCVRSTSDCCAQNPSQDTLFTKICPLAVHTCVPGPGSKAVPGAPRAFWAGAVCFVAVGPEQDLAAAFSGAR